MTKVRAGKGIFDVDAVVFDKDGLLFDSQYFWKALAQIRVDTLREIDGFPIDKWCSLFGVERENGEILSIHPSGIFAIASPQEEAVVTASLLHEATGDEWGRCRRRAVEAFEESDKRFDVRRALLPKPGFPRIFRELRDVGIPYGVATSDDAERTRVSVDQFDEADSLRFIVTPVEVKRGKPNPDMLLLISEMLGIPCNRMMMIGDSYVDVQMAQSAGCIGIGIPDDAAMKDKMMEYDCTILESLEELEVMRGR
ncbi:HAD family hydrolase [Cohnella pontilimi]|uniref:HAD family hydrolase n=1 Tax=Cohnella pontilimi TaxID=2564100 RepID=UPI00145DF48E|nr:HAD family phosphatase [Cohnella pontilimi]